MLKKRKVRFLEKNRQRSKREVYNEGKEKENMRSITWLCIG
jgi:hypothetical protein